MEDKMDEQNVLLKNVSHGLDITGPQIKDHIPLWGKEKQPPKKQKQKERRSQSE